jgi:hypothetical protein
MFILGMLPALKGRPKVMPSLRDDNSETDRERLLPARRDSAVCVAAVVGGHDGVLVQSSRSYGHFSALKAHNSSFLLGDA